MDSQIELVTFVSRAENRITTLRTLADSPQTRQELEDATEIPRATLSRILADCRDRELVTKTNYEYAVTQLGEVLITELESVFESVAAMETLQTVRQWLAIDAYDIPTDGFSDADVIVPTPTDPMAPVRRAEELLAGASRVRILAYSMVPGCLAAVWRAVTDGRQTFEGVLTHSAVQTMVDDPEMATHARDIFGDGNAKGYVHPDEMLPLLFVVDDVVFIAVVSDGGTIQGHIETTNASVMSWATDTIDRYVAEAEPLRPETLTG